MLFLFFTQAIYHDLTKDQRFDQDDTNIALLLHTITS